MHLITMDLNGIRSATTKGFFAWLVRQQADVVCMQDLKAQETEIPTAVRQLDELRGYFGCDAQLCLCGRQHACNWASTPW